MDRWSQNKTETARAIWSRLVGCFGDALLRKFGPEPPEEWIGALGMLTAAQHERGLRRLVFGWKGGPPSLPDFMRLCRAVGTDEFDEGVPALPALAAPDNFKGDVWDEAASRFLLGHIAKRMKQDPNFYGRPASYKMLAASEADLTQLGIDRHYLDASGEFVANVNKLVAAKKAWAEDMRDLAVNGEVPPSTQKAVWYDYFKTAEQSVIAGQRGMASQANAGSSRP